MTEHRRQLAPRPARSARLDRAFVTPHAFWLGVGAISLGAGAFLRPPADGLAAARGRDAGAVRRPRHPRGRVEHVTRERGGAPLHFLLAWVVAHLGGGLGEDAPRLGVFAVGEPPARRAPRSPARRPHGAGLSPPRSSPAAGCCSSTAIYARMYSLFLFLSPLSFLLLLRALDRAPVAGVGGVGGRSPARRRSASVWRARVRGTGCRSSSSHDATGFDGRRVAFGVGARPAAPRSGSPISSSPDRFDVGVGGRGLEPRWLVGGVTYLWHTAGDFSTGRGPRSRWSWRSRSWPRVVRRETRVLVARDRDARCRVPARGSADPPPRSQRHLIFVLPLFAIARRVPVSFAARGLCPGAGAALIAVPRRPRGRRGRGIARRSSSTGSRTSGRRPVRRPSGSSPRRVTTGRHALRLRTALPRRLGTQRPFPAMVVPRADASWRSATLARCDRSRSAAASGSSTRANATTCEPRLEIENRDPGPPGSSRRALRAVPRDADRQPVQTIDAY